MSDENPTTPPPEPPATPAADPPEPAVPPPATPPAAPPSSAGGGSGASSENRNFMIVLSYLWVLAVIPFLFEKDDAEVKWHAKHGLVLTAAEILLWIVVSLVNSVVSLVPVVGCLGGCGLYLVLWVGTLAFRIIVMSKALKGERMTVPGLSEFADKF